VAPGLGLLLGPQSFLLPLRRGRRQLLVLHLQLRLRLRPLLRLDALLRWCATRRLRLDRHHRQQPRREHPECNHGRKRFTPFQDKPPASF